MTMKAIDRFGDSKRSAMAVAGPRASIFGDETERPTSGSIRILRLAQVIDMTGIRKTKIYELQAAGDFPARVRITSHSVGWVEGDIQTWLSKRIEASALARAAASTIVRPPPL